MSSDSDNTDDPDKPARKKQPSSPKVDQREATPDAQHHDDGPDARGRFAGAAPGRSSARTRGVVVEVLARHQSERSRPSEGRWFFSYRIEIRNEGTQSVQLMSRRWLIRDAEGREEEVRGPGVIGEQPLLAPGESFIYCSGCPLETPLGSMSGHFEMVGEDGVEFLAEVARFDLTEPYAIN